MTGIEEFAGRLSYFMRVIATQDADGIEREATRLSMKSLTGE